MDLGISGRTALVTAGSKGIGRAIAQRLVQEGVSVGVCARGSEALEQTVAELREHGGRADGVIADISTAEGCERAVRDVESALGAIDILVTNTGGPKPGLFFDCDDEAWQSGFESTVLNIVRLVRATAPGMCERGWGRIVHIASMSAKQPITGLTMSNTMRPAILGLSKSLSDELAPKGVTVNTLCPGMHATDRLLHLRQNDGESTEELHARLSASIPARRVGDPDDLAQTAAFLCSEGAGYVTGSTFVVDGGAVRGLA